MMTLSFSSAGNRPRRVAELRMGRRLASALLLGLLSASQGAALSVPCSWPVETTGVGASNVAYPDTDATYWTMPFDATTSAAMRITGEFPAGRFLSFTVYDAQGGEASALIDENIVPDAGSSNPFTPAGAGSSGGTYTVTVLGPSGTAAANTLVLPSAVGYVLLRLYVPDEGLDRQGGVALPQIVLIAADDSEALLPSCVEGASAVARTR